MRIKRKNLPCFVRQHSVRVDGPMNAQLYRLSEQTGEPIANLIRYWIAQGIRDYDHEPLPETLDTAPGVRPSKAA